MNPEAYRVEAALERDHWWFRGRRRILRRFLATLALPPHPRVLDVGCGTGANGPALPGFTVGVDAAALPLGLGRQDTHRARLRGDAGRLPFVDGAFDLVCALDVLEHLPDDAAALRELHRLLRPGGALVVFVPALSWLWGLQDEVAHHLRRYARRPLASLVETAGFHVERLTYFNTLLFPPIAAARLAMRLWRPDVQSENEVGGPATSALAGWIFAAEAPLLDRVDLPIGVSLACVARRSAR